MEQDVAKCALSCLDKAVLAEGQVCSSVEAADAGQYKLHHRLHFELFDIGPLWFRGRYALRTKATGVEWVKECLHEWVALLNCLVGGEAFTHHTH